MLNHQFRDPSDAQPNELTPAEMAEIHELEELTSRKARYIASQLRIIRDATRYVQDSIKHTHDFDLLCAILDERVPECWGDLEHPKDIADALEDIRGALLNCGVK